MQAIPLLRKDDRAWVHKLYCHSYAKHEGGKAYESADCAYDVEQAFNQQSIVVRSHLEADYGRFPAGFKSWLGDRQLKDVRRILCLDTAAFADRDDSLDLRVAGLGGQRDQHFIHGEPH